MNAAARALVAFALLAGPGWAAASPREDLPFVVRGEASALLQGFGFGPSLGFVGVGAAVSFNRVLSAEVTLGGGPGAGARGELMARAALELGATGENALTVAVGPSVVGGKVYGAVWFTRVELAFERRGDGGFTLLVGGGPSWALNDSRAAPYESSCDWLCPDNRFRSGGLGLYARLAMGVGF